MKVKKIRCEGTYLVCGGGGLTYKKNQTKQISRVSLFKGTVACNGYLLIPFYLIERKDL